MPQARRPPRETTAVPKERQTFKTLLAQNLNYFGNLEESKLKPVKKIVYDTTFEQLNCVGFNPDGNVLEATIADQAADRLQRRPLLAGQHRVRPLLRRLRNRVGGRRPDRRQCPRHPERERLRRAAREAAQLRREPPHRPEPRAAARIPCCRRVRAILSWQWVPPAGTSRTGTRSGATSSSARSRSSRTRGTSSASSRRSAT